MAKAERDQRHGQCERALRDVGLWNSDRRETERFGNRPPKVDQDGTCWARSTVTQIRRSNAIPLCTSASIQVTDAGLSASRGMEQWLAERMRPRRIRLHLPQAKVGQEPEVREEPPNDLQLTSVDLGPRS